MAAKTRSLDPMRALVLGATGSIGQRVARELVGQGCEVVVASRSRSAATSVAASVSATDAVAIDIDDAHWDIPDGVTLVIDCTGSDDARTALRACASGSSFIDVSASMAHVRQLFDHDEEVRAGGYSVVVGAGLAPGISTMLAHHLLSGDSTKGVRIDLVLDLFDSFGDQASEYTTELIGTSFSNPSTGRDISNFSSPTTTHAPAGFGTSTTARVGFADLTILAERFDQPVDMNVGFQQFGVTRFLAALTRRHVGAVRRLVKLGGRLSTTTRPRPWLCIASNSEQRAWATGIGQASATAAHVGLIARRLHSSGPRPGVIAAHDVAPLDTLSSHHLHQNGVAVAIDRPYER